MEIWVLLHLPEQMDETEWLEYRSLLDVHDDKREALNVLFSSYRDQWRHMSEESIEPLRAHAREMGEIAERLIGTYEPFVGRDYAQKYQALVANRELVCKEIYRIERSFATALTAVIGPGREETILRIEQHRRRASVPAGHITRRFSWANVDLIELARGAGIESVLANNAVQQVVDHYAARYYLVASRLLEDRFITNASAIVSRAEAWFDKSGVALSDTSEQLTLRLDAINNELRRKQKEMLRLEDRIGEINLDYLKRIAAHLPEKDAKILREAFNTTVFPEVYPDYSSVHAEFEKLLHVEQLEEEVKKAVVEQYRNYHMLYSTICGRMTKRVMKHARLRAEGEMEGIYPRQEIEDFKSDMADLVEERCRLNQRWGEQLKRLVEGGTR